MPAHEEAATTNAPPPRDDADRPPTPPGRWAKRDRALGAQVRLRAQAPSPIRGEPPCDCGGRWRYALLPHARHPLWRCLHCGGLHRGDQRIPEADDARGAAD